MAGRASGAAGALPIAAICCLGILLLAIASTIVLALIPVYLSRKNVSLAPFNAHSTTGTYSVPLTSGVPTGTLSSSQNAQLQSGLTPSLKDPRGRGTFNVQSATVTTSGKRKRALGSICILVIIFFASTLEDLRRYKALFEVLLFEELAFFTSLLSGIVNSGTTTTVTTTTAAAVVSTAGTAVSTASGRRRRNILLRRQAQQAAVEAANTYKD